MSALALARLPWARHGPRRRRVLVGAAVAALIAVGALAAGGVAAQAGLGANRDVVEYRAPDPQDIPAAVAVAPDGVIWFTLESSDAVGVLRDGQIHKLARGGETLEALGLAADGQGGVWLTDITGQAISHLALDGTREAVHIPGPLAQLGRLALGPDGTVWFADGWSNSVTRLRDGRLEMHPAAEANAAPFGVAVGPDGTVWATLQIANKLLRIDPEGSIAELDVPTRNATPTDIAVDSSGSVWFTELRANKLVHYTQGRFTEFNLPAEAPGVTGLAVAPDGTVWAPELRRQRLLRVRDGVLTEFSLPRPEVRPFDVAVAPSGDVWYTDLSGWVGKLPAARARSDELDLRRVVAWLRG